MSYHEILNDSFLNKGLAFTQKERDVLGLNGLLPYSVLTLPEQVSQKYKIFKQQPNDLAKYVFLTSIQNQNESLFYYLVSRHLTEMLPLIYTPNIGDVSLSYSAFYTHHKGLYLSYPLKEKIPAIIESLMQKEVDVIVVTDGERILGLGDLGAGGMAISMGKLNIYTLLGGINPSRTLPIVLDVGTNNKMLLDDPYYIGWRHKRISGSEYDDFVDVCVQAFKKKYPSVLLQWEDFGHVHARALLDRYQDQICSFNDDIQGTAAVVLAAIIASCKVTNTKMAQQKIVVLGGGSAGMGIIHHVLGALMQEGVCLQEAKKAFYIVDRDGLVHKRQKDIASHHFPFAQELEGERAYLSLLDVVREVRPTILIGTSAQKGAFTEEVIKAMAEGCQRPLIMPLSNPNSKSEAHPADLISWTEGRGIIATGSPFEPVFYKGQWCPIAQCNNVSIFPGLGLGIVACKSKKVTESMFYKAAEILSSCSPLLQDASQALFPPIEKLSLISQKIAIGVVEVAQKEGLCPKTSQKEIESMVKKTVWSFA